VNATVTIAALVVGSMGGLGLWLVVTSPRRARVNLIARVAPWVSELSEDAHAVAIRSIAPRALSSRAWAKAFASHLPDAASSWLRGGERTQVLLRQAGRDFDAGAWSVRVMEFATYGALAGLALGGVLVVLGFSTIVVVAALVLVGACSGVVGAKYALARAARARSTLILDELPVICELLAICLTAGEGFPEALRRVTSRGDGPLVRELRRVLTQSSLGLPLADELSTLSRELNLTPLSRTLDHVIAGLERGAPLAGVLRTQAGESRAEAGRRLQERASAREVVMLLPLVFLILPITIAFTKVLLGICLW
jgi:tight adherence protein C